MTRKTISPVGKAQPTPRCEARIFKWDRLNSESSLPVKLGVLEAERVARETEITGKNSRIRELEEQLEQSKRQTGVSAERKRLHERVTVTNV